MYIFQLASQHADWLAIRQSVTANNIANSDTPGFKAMDVVPFDAVLQRTGLELAATSSGHMALPPDAQGSLATQRQSAWDVSSDGNDVSLESELMKVSENGRQQALDTGLVKTFQRMLLSSLKV